MQEQEAFILSRLILDHVSPEITEKVRDFTGGWDGGMGVGLRCKGKKSYVKMWRKMGKSETAEETDRNELKGEWEGH